jgi:nucleotide-binding universal stress UspA family protein
MEQFIAEAFRQRRYDLVIIAAEERSGLIRLVRGSRVGPLMHQTPSSVLLVRDPEPKIEHLLVGVSASPNSQHDVRLAGILAKAFGARVTLAHVVSQIPLVYTSLRQQQMEAELQAFLRTADPAAIQLQRAQDLLAEMGVVARLALREGLVRNELIALCRMPERGVPLVDLLVIGAHERTPRTGIDYYDDIAEQVAVSAPLSTLIVHAESDWAAWQPI